MRAAGFLLPASLLIALFFLAPVIGTLGLSFIEVGFDQNNEAVVHATSYFRDDLLRFRLIRRKAGA